MDQFKNGFRSLPNVRCAAIPQKLLLGQTGLPSWPIRFGGAKEMIAVDFSTQSVSRWSRLVRTGNRTPDPHDSLSSIRSTLGSSELLSPQSSRNRLYGYPSHVFGSPQPQVLYADV